MDCKSILFPVDFSPRCEAAVPQVKAMARLFDASIYLLHVLEFPYYGEMGAVTFPETQVLEMKARASRELAGMVSPHFDGLTVTAAVRQGDPAGEITAFAENHGVGLIMMPTRGHGRFRAALLGSVTSKVLDDAHCRVWTSSHAEQWLPGRTDGIRGALCAIDLSDESGPMIRAAAEFAEQTGARIRLVHAIPGEESPSQRGIDPQFERFLKDTARNSVARLQRETGTFFELCLEAGKPSRVIAAAARHHDADLVIIGRGKRNEFAGHLRTEAYSIIRDSPCPVLSF